jgi:toxin ParE1/3/4
MQLEITLTARRDVFALQEFGNANFGVAHTRKYLVGLTQTFKNIRDRPELARLREEYDGNIRIHTHKSHLIFYRIEGDIVRVLRVLSRHQNWPDFI